MSHLEDVDFADDVALLSHRHSDMEDTVSQRTFGRLEIKVNSRKIKTMGVNQANSNSITVDGREVEDVQQFTSLGSCGQQSGRY